jgi:hypothetical protein
MLVFAEMLVRPVVKGLSPPWLGDSKPAPPVQAFVASRFKTIYGDEAAGEGLRPAFQDEVRPSREREGIEANLTTGQTAAKSWGATLRHLVADAVIAPIRREAIRLHGVNA